MINFPDSPILGQEYLSPSGIKWIWNGYAWDTVTIYQSPSLNFKDEGVSEGTTDIVKNIDFTGGGVNASRTGDTLTVNVMSGGSSSYLHIQSVASPTWTVNHNLGFKPGGIKVFDSSDKEWFGEIIYLDDNTLTIDFNGLSFGGKAYIS